MGISDNDALTDIDLSALTTIQGQFSLSGNVILAAANLSSLESVGQSMFGGSMYVTNNPLLTSLAIDSLTTLASSMTISSNASLATLSFALLNSMGTLTIQNNIDLPTCAAIAIRDQLILAGWTGSSNISGNDDTGTCL